MTEKETHETEEEGEEEKSTAPGLLQSADEKAARLEKALNKADTIVSRLEALKVEQTLGGKTEASVPPKEETPAEYTKKIMSGEQ